MFAGSVQSALQTSIICLLGGLTLGLLIICSSKVPQFGASDTPHGDIVDALPTAGQLQTLLSQSDSDDISSLPKTGVSNDIARLHVSITKNSTRGEKDPGQSLLPSNQSQTSNLTLKAMAHEHTHLQRTHLEDGWTLRGDEVDFRKGTKADEQSTDRGSIALDLSGMGVHQAAALLNSTQISLDSSTSQVARLQDGNEMQHARPKLKEGSRSDHAAMEDNEDLDFDYEDEDPDPDVLQDGQDQDPIDKARQIMNREKAEEKREENVQEIHKIVASVIAKGKAEKGDLSSQNGQGKSNKDILDELLNVQKDLERLAKPKKRPEELSAAALMALGKQAHPLENNLTQAKPKGSSIADLSQSEARKLVKHGKANYRIGKGLSRKEQAFIYQMSDILALDGGSDMGGESLRMMSLTEEEANAADSQEFNSLKAYGASEGDMVTFLHVKQGQPKDSKAMTAKRAEAATGLPLLTMDVIRNHTVENLVIVATACWSSYDFALNWAAHLRSRNITNFLIGALDQQTSLGLASLGIPGFRMFPPLQGAVGLSMFDFQSLEETQHKQSRQKIALAQLFADFGYDILFSDVQSVWLRNPTPYFQSMQHVDILVGSDALNSTAVPGGEGLESISAINGALSLSLMYIRQSKHVSRFLQAWDDLLAGQVTRVGHIAFNTLLADRFRPLLASPRNARVAWSPGHNVTVGVLNPALFANGHTFFIQKLHQEKELNPYSVLVNFVYGGAAAKRHRLRETGLWKNAPNYYDRPNGFVEVELEGVSVPRSFWSEADMIKFHTQQLTDQLKQVRAGIAIASALERALIIPQLKCFCDRLWSYKGRCRAPEARGTLQLYSCPLDTILDVQSFLSEGRHRGPPIEFREHNLLDQPTTPSHMKASRVKISAEPEQQSLLDEMFGSEGEELVSIGSGLSEQQLHAALIEQRSVKILSFKDAAKVFGGFSDRSWAEAMANRLTQIRGSWQYGATSKESYTYGADHDVQHLTYAQSL